MSRLILITPVILLSLAVTAARAQDAKPLRGARPGGGPGPMGAGRGGPGFQPPPLPLLEALDADKDGKLSKEEIENAAAALKKLDKNEDGVLSSEEIGWPPAGRGFGGRGGRGFGPSGPGGPGGRADGVGGGRGFGRRGDGAGPAMDIAQRIMRNDRNGDGKVTRDELPEFMRRIMDRADANGDGAIDRDEARSMAEAFGRGGGFGRGGDRGPDRPERPKRDGG